MKKSTIVKFSLSLVCSAVLAACSSGGSSAPAVNNNNADLLKQEELKKQEELRKQQEELERQKEQAVANSSSFGHKFVKKTESNFIETTNPADGTAQKNSNSQGDQTNMELRLHDSLDTVVVSVPYTVVDGKYVVDPTKEVGYVEDFDFRNGEAELAAARVSGETTLTHIYKTADGSTAEGDNRTMVDGPDFTSEKETYLIRGVTKDTKTATKGKDSGKVLVYQTDRTNYIGTDEKVTGNVENLRDRSQSVAEVYGHRTFVHGNAETGVDEAVADIGANAPFGQYDSATGQYSAVKLNNVQYGRVTSRLHGVKVESVKDGIETDVTTKVVSYGDYNTEGTENSYFYRGVNDTTYSKTLATDLADKYATTVNDTKTAAGSLKYQGHAVTYGFEHTAPDSSLKTTVNSDTPNAVRPKFQQTTGSVAKLVSGTHVSAMVDLATKQVTGNLYNVWSLDDVKSNRDIATFSGRLENSGQISGTSTRTADNAAGSFEANIYGADGQELGGGIASKATGADQSWGAVFGAKVQNSLYVAPSVVPDSAWGTNTEGK